MKKSAPWLLAFARRVNDSEGKGRRPLGTTVSGARQWRAGALVAAVSVVLVVAASVMVGGCSDTNAGLAPSPPVDSGAPVQDSGSTSAADSSAATDSSAASDTGAAAGDGGAAHTGSDASDGG